MNPIYPAHCVPCLAKKVCPDLPHSIICKKLRRLGEDACSEGDYAQDRNEQDRIDKMRGDE